MKPFIAIVLALALAPPLNAGNCNVLYRQQAVVYAQPVVAYAPIYYGVGQNLQLEALVKAEVRKQVQAALQAAPQSRVAVTDANGETRRFNLATPVLVAKCARCHSGESPKGGIDLSGTKDIPVAVRWRIVEIIGDGVDVPKAMTGTVAALTQKDKGDMTQEMIHFAKPKAEAPPEPGAGVLE